MQSEEGGPGAVGRAKPWLIVGLLGALILMIVAIIVAVRGGGEPSATPPAEAVQRCDDPHGPVSARAGQVLAYFTCEPPPADPRPVGRDAIGAAEGVDQLRVAVEQLLAGPTPAERDAGMSSVFPARSDALLIGLELQEGGLAVIDFSDELRHAGPLNTSHNRFIGFTTLAATIFQFDEVEAIEYRIDGSCAEFARHFETTCEPWLRDG